MQLINFGANLLTFKKLDHFSAMEKKIYNNEMVYLTKVGKFTTKIFTDVDLGNIVLTLFVHYLPIRIISWCVFREYNLQPRLIFDSEVEHTLVESIAVSISSLCPFSELSIKLGCSWMVVTSEVD